MVGMPAESMAVMQQAPMRPHSVATAFDDDEDEITASIPDRSLWSQGGDTDGDDLDLPTTCPARRQGTGGRPGPERAGDGEDRSPIRNAGHSMVVNVLTVGSAIAIGIVLAAMT